MTRLHSNYRMAKHNRKAAYSHNSKDLKYDLTSQQKNCIEPAPMAISMFKYTYRSELQGNPSKLKLRAIPKQVWNTVLYKARTNDHNKPIRYHTPISGNKINNWWSQSSSKDKLISTIPASWNRRTKYPSSRTERN